MYEVETEDILKAQNKSEEALAKIVEANTGLIWSIVKRFSGRGYLRRGLISNRMYRVNKSNTKI